MRRDIKINVESLVLAESATYRDQFLRPYVTEVRGDVTDRIGERFQKSRRFTPSMLANIANQFIVPDSRPRGIIEIPHGWDERRGRFILTLEIIVGTGDRLRQVVMGYTNTTGFSSNNRVDMDMEFYINNTYMLVEKTIKTNRGYRSVYAPTSMNDVLADRDNAGARRRSDRRYTIRPEDIYSTIDADQMLDMVDDLTDLRTTLHRSAIKSRSSNRIGSRYMASVLNSRQKAIELHDHGNNPSEINATAQGYIQESYASEDLFMRRLTDVQDLDEATTTSFFTFRHLLSIDPYAEKAVNANLFSKEALPVTDYRRYDDVNEMNGQEEHDRIAALIATAIPALMMENCIHQINFQAHNQSHGEEFVFVPSKTNSMIDDLDMKTFTDIFEERLIDELLVPITADSRFEIGIELQCRIFGDINFTLFWDGKKRGRYIFPCFCNALSSPIITDDVGDVKKIARDFNDLFDEFLPATLGSVRKDEYNF